VNNIAFFVVYTSGPVSARMGDRLRAVELSRYVTRHPLLPRHYVGRAAFSGKYHVNLGNFVNFWANINKKIRYFVNFSFIIFGQKCCPP